MRIWEIVGFSVLPERRLKRMRKERQVFRFKKSEEHESDGETKCSWHILNAVQSLGSRVGSVRNRRMGQEHPNYSIFKIGQYTEKSPKRPEETKYLSQTPGKDD